MPITPPRAKAAKRLVVLDGPRAGGAVWLIGAGPGDPDLLTVKACRVLATADVVVHDGLVSPAILDLAPAKARRISVAKRKSHHSYAQEDINRLLVALALEGLVVARLKGGDPFVFGRGGEEVAACRAAGVECQVIPGVTAALAAGDAEPDLDWRTLATANQTVVIYMGLSKAALIAARLIDAGRATSTPVLIVENVSLPHERRIATRLDDLAGATLGLAGPALLMIGEAMALARVDAPAIVVTTDVGFEEVAR